MVGEEEGGKLWCGVDGFLPELHHRIDHTP